MSITYVSALYNIYEATTTSERLIRDVEVLLKQQLTLIMFVDDFFERILKTMKISSTVKIIPMPLEEIAIYNMIVQNKVLIQIPSYRNQTKDTHEYVALMNSKIEFMLRARPYISTDHVAWIDAGSSKMIKQPIVTYNKLLLSTLTNVPTTLFPGCYQREVPFKELQHQVWWVFIGTFFICNTTYVRTFYNLSLQSLTRFLLSGTIPWEVNVWIDMKQHNPEAFKWYHSGHDDGFAQFPRDYLL